MAYNVYDLITLNMEQIYAKRAAFRYYDADTQQVVTKTYGQYAQDIRRAVTYLKQTVPDIKGKRVCILSGNCYEYAVDSFGILMAGAVAVPLNQRKTWAELQYELELTEPAAILTDYGDYDYRPQLDAAYGALLHPMDGFAACEPAQLTRCIDPNEMMVLMFTSGTTGRSKGVMLSEHNFFTVMVPFAEMGDHMCGYKRDPELVLSSLTMLPMFHIGTFICFFSWAMKGWALNLSNDVRDFYRDIQRMPSQAMALVPVLMQSIHRDVMRGHKEKLGDLWVPVCGSAMFNKQDMLDLSQHGMFVLQTYGLTETCALGLINYAQEEAHINSVGRECFGCEYKLEPDGELCIRGGNVMLGYYKDPAATAEVIDPDGWFHTGDLARRDEEGYYYITGRKKNLIILDSGENISPEFLEGLLGRCEAVKECLVREMGKKIGAVVWCDPAQEQAVRDYITQTNRTLPLYERINAVEFSAGPLPRNAAGKLLR